MGDQIPLGPKLRRLRRRQGITQAALANRLGISASYLNLIEHGQRALTAPLLVKLSEHYGIDTSELAGGEEARLLSDMAEIYADPRFSHLRPEPEDLLEAVAQSPKICETALALYRAYHETRQSLLGFNEDLSQDPYLADSSHKLLTALTSVRSFAEILQDNVELEADRRQEFAGVLVAESGRLTALINELFDFIATESTRRGRPGQTPEEEVDDAMQERRNHFPELEEAAETARRQLRLPEPEDHCEEPARRLLAHLQTNHGLTLESIGDCVVPDSEGRSWHFDAHRKHLQAIDALPPASLRFRLAHVLGRLSQADLFTELGAATAFSSREADMLYQRVLANYFAAALIMPYDSMRSMAEARRYDIEALTRVFDVSFEQACQRLVTLQRPGAEGVPFHFLRSDIAGTISKRFSVSGLNLPRYGSLCPRWNLHTAFTNIGRIERQVVQFTDGGRYLFIAHASAGPAGPRQGTRGYNAISIGCDVSFAHRVIYADGLNLEAEGATPVGISCRRCDRRDCAQRTAPPPARDAP